MTENITEGHDGTIVTAYSLYPLLTKRSVVGKTLSYHSMLKCITS
uniref:Uncharacterized protein n=1 Tax=Myoviridae sp. ctxjh1 TaxID=2826714 RepID=A0A8S5R0D6_9CAUD|nr:MAG TPA: hypothetical protein [Myoviridae sp. ctxjh1]